MSLDTFSPLILPGDPAFSFTLATARRPDWRQREQVMGEPMSFVVEPGSGLARPVSQAELEEYLEGGEYDERLDEIGEMDDDEGW